MNKEIWKNIKGFEKYYQVSNLGRVRSIDRFIYSNRGKTKYKRFFKCTILKPKKNNGYLSVSLKVKNRTKFVTVHRLVAKTFIKNNKNLKCVNHKNFIRNDNRVSNLEWVTHKQNIAYTHLHGRNADVRGEKHPMSKLSNKDVLKIRNLKKQGMQQIKIAEMFNVTPSMISYIVTNKNWSHLLIE